MEFDVAVIGCGPGGMEVSRVLAKAGAKIAVVEDGQWGGTCLNKGCVPTKMLLAATAPGNVLTSLARQKEASGAIKIDYEGLSKRVWRHVGASSRTIAANLEKFGATLFVGRAGELAPGRALVAEQSGEKKEIKFKTLILATGSRPAFFPAVAPDHQVLLDSDDLLRIDHIPESLCVIGAGAIGLEFASFFSSCGTKITIVEAAPRLAPTEDKDIGDALKTACAKRGYLIYLGVGAKEARNDAGRAVLDLIDGTRIEAEVALAAVGRVGAAPNVAALGAKVDRRGFIEVNENLLAAENVYAIGDCNGKTLLAHAATHQGLYVARRILGETKSAYASGPIPSCIFGFVEVMRAGLSEREAAGRGEVKVSVSPLASNPISQAFANPMGFVKAVWLDGALVGMAAVGGDVSHLVTAAELLVAGNYTPEKLNGIMMAHPSLDESLGGAIRQKRVPANVEEPV